MGELTRFRLLRDPGSPCGSSSALPLAPAGHESELLAQLVAVAGPDADRGEGYRGRLADVAGHARKAGGFPTDGESTAHPALLVDDLVAWLTCHPDDPENLLPWLAAQLEKRDIEDVAPDEVFQAILGAGDWQRLLTLLRDDLLLLLIEASVPVLDGGSRVVSRDIAAAVGLAVMRLRVATLIEQWALATDDLDAGALRQALTVPVATPSPPFPLVPAPRTAGPPIVADLYVVRDEWARYEAGELAFIENVMPGEERERSTRTTNRTQVVVEAETIDVSRTRTETYESERTTEAEESSKQTSLEIGLQFANELSVQYGPVANNTQIGASLAFSRSEAERRATEIARESGRRAIVETERQVRQLKRETSETTVRELDAHRLSNQASTAVQGVYRWVERIQRYQLFRYPHRLQLEFYLPEPGKFLRRLLEEREAATDAFPVPEPLYLTEDGSEAGTPIDPGAITEDNYLDLGLVLGIADLPAPPDPELVVTESIALNAGTRPQEKNSWEMLPFPPVAAGTKDIQVPEGYQAVAWSAAAAAAPELASWRDYTDDSDDGIEEKKGYHSIVAAVTVGPSNVLIRNFVERDGAQEFNTVHVGGTDYRDRWLARNANWNGAPSTTFTTPLVGKLSFGATMGGAFNGTVSITLKCEPTDRTLGQWRTEVYGLLSSAVEARRRAIATALAANREETAETVRQAVSPSVRKALIRDELKRQVLDSLLGARFEGFDDAPDSDDSRGVTRPAVKFDDALAHSVFVRFFEQSFEWDNMMHVLYPSYWGPSGTWSRRVDFASGDLELTAFLDSGGARVLVPARPGFEPAVYTFLELGLVLGTDALGGDGTGSLSVAEEIMALTRPPADGEPGESWEAPVPTAMLWLDTNLTLPITNDTATLPQA